MQELCGAKARTTGGTCLNRAMYGQRRCRMHGGGSPNARYRAELRLAEAEVLASVRAVYDAAVAVRDDDYAGQARRYVKDLRALVEVAADRMRPPLSDRRRAQLSTALDDAIEREWGFRPESAADELDRWLEATS